MKKKYALISGASRGIGRSIALKLARSNYHVFINCRTSFTELRQVQEEIRKQDQGGCTIVTGDVGNPDSVRQIFAEIHQITDRLDVLVNNAGCAHIGLLSDMSDQDWRMVIAANLDSVFYCCRAAIPAMVKAKEGKIINISSIWGVSGASCEAAYSAAKSGIHGLTQALAKELAPSNVQVNAVACGVIDTQMNASLLPDERKALEEDIPAGRFGEPDEVADFVLDLVNGTGYLTGQVIVLDGGYL